MRDSTKIEDLKYSFGEKTMTPAQTYITPFGEVYVSFKKTDGSYINIHSSDVKKYIVNGLNR
jgi:hypothetical protein